jgi:molybdopterin molybdotransferase
MRSVEEARDAILASATLTASEWLPLDRCAGRVLVGHLMTAASDVPPFANSSMDGFAVRSADAPGKLRLAGEVAAGSGEAPTLAAGTAVRIMTGAPLPSGADTVVPLEEARESERSVRVPAAEPGAYVRPAGLDTRAGDQVELPIEPLTPAAIAVLASLGMGEVEVRRRPRVAIVSTGDELVAPGDALRPGQIFDANSAALAAAVLEAGGDPVILPLGPDDPAAIEGLVRWGIAVADLLVASGGVSVGRRDHVREVIERIGTLDFWRIQVQPGKPLAFGAIDGRPVIGLPGNPVSALVTFELFVRPLLRAMLGLPGDGRLRVAARIDESIAKDEGRRAYLRVVVRRDGDGYAAHSAGGQASSQLRPLAAANGLLIVPDGLAATEPGQSYETLLIGAVP